MNTLSDKLIEKAKSLMKKHGQSVAYVIVDTEQIYFSKNNATITAKGKEVVEVKADNISEPSAEELAAAAAKKEAEVKAMVKEAEKKAKAEGAIDLSKDNVVILEDEAAAKAKAEEESLAAQEADAKAKAEADVAAKAANKSTKKK